jgi:hypothetical protein
MGKGVPNIAVNVFASPPDPYGGYLLLNDEIRVADNPLRLMTNGNGEFAFTVKYLTSRSYLEEKGCRACTPIGCDIARVCRTIYPIYGTWFTCGHRTPGYVYQLTAKVEGTVLSTIGVLTAYANLVG